MIWLLYFRCEKSFVTYLKKLRPSVIFCQSLKPNYFRRQCSSSSFLLTQGDNTGDQIILATRRGNFGRFLFFFWIFSKQILKLITVLSLMWNPEICQDTPSCGQDDLDLVLWLKTPRLFTFIMRLYLSWNSQLGYSNWLWPSDKLWYFNTR